MLAHRLNPMQSQAVQHGARALHHAENSNSQEKPHVEEHNGRNDAQDSCESKALTEGHIP